MQNLGKELPRVKILEREFFLGLCENKDERRILELIMDNVDPKEIVKNCQKKIWMRNDFPIKK